MCSLQWIMKSVQLNQVQCAGNLGTVCSRSNTLCSLFKYSVYSRVQSGTVLSAVKFNVQNILLEFEVQSSRNHLGTKILQK